MGTGHAGRSWLIGGALSAVVLVAVGWFFLISPRNGQTASLRDQTDAASVQQITLRHRLADLQQQNDRLAGYQAQRDRDRAALPTAADLANVLRDLQTADDTRGVVTGVLVGSPLEETTAGTKAYALPLTVSATGTATQLNRLLDYLQQDQRRAVLITGVHLTGDDNGSLAGPSSLSLALAVFVAAPDGTPSVAPNATASAK